MTQKHIVFSRRHIVRICLSLVFFAWAGTGISPAVEKYVTPTGAGAYSGNDWDNAYSNVQEAVTACPNAGDSIYLKEGIYTNAAQVNVLNHPGLTIRGGYLGSGMTLGGESVLTRAAGISNRIVYASASTLVFDRVTISNGAAALGAGLCLSNSCNTTITNCTLTYNRVVAAGVAGAGIYAVGGSLKISDSLLSSNIATLASGMALYGGGIYASGVAVTLNNVTLEKNALVPYYAYGGGVYLSGGSAMISNCRFNTNYFKQYGTSGSALYASDVNELTIEGCDFVGNFAQCHSYIHYGATLYIGGSKSFAVSGCSFSNNYTSGYPAGRGTLLYLAGGVRGTIDGCAIAAYGISNISQEEICLATTCAVTIANTTIRGRGGKSRSGITKEASGAFTLTNCVVSGYPTNGIYATNNAGAINIYNCIITENGNSGIYLADTGSAVVSSCYISNNMAVTGAGGAGIFMTHGQVRNSLILNNTNLSAGGFGGGVIMTSAAANTNTPYGLVNCVIANNFSATEGGGVAVVGATNLVANCIIISNSSALGIYPDIYATGGNSNGFWSCCANVEAAPLPPGQGNITNDPVFKDASAGNYRLASGSPCINAGTNQAWMTNSFDLDGNMRIRYGVVDMGAYERSHNAALYNFH